MSDERKMYLLTLHGGGGDLACSVCLPVARAAKRASGQLVGDAPTTTTPGEYCAWCGWEPDPTTERRTP